MSRYNIPQEQIDSMDMTTVSSLLNDMQEEMCDLANLEYSLYTRRRELEKELQPELFIEPEMESEVKKLDALQLRHLLKVAIDRGIDLKDLV